MLPHSTIPAIPKTRFIPLIVPIRLRMKPNIAKEILSQLNQPIIK